MQTFSAGADFPSSGTWNTSGNLGAGVANPGSRLAVNGGAAVGADYATIAAPLNGLLGKRGCGHQHQQTLSRSIVFVLQSIHSRQPQHYRPASWERLLTQIIIITVWPSPAPPTLRPAQVHPDFSPRPGVNGAVAGGVFAGSVHFVTQGDLGFLQANSPWLGWKPDAAGTIRDVIMAVYGGVKYQDDGGAWGSVCLKRQKSGPYWP